MAISINPAMNSIIQNLEVRWADLDPNLHLRHSVYYDFAATSRIRFLQQEGITPHFMQEHSFGPILFREECIFRKEIRIDDTVSIDITLLKARPDLTRWTIRHTIFKNGDTVSAVVTVDGAWIDTIKRKLAMPPERVKAVFERMPRGAGFEWISKIHH